jgi:hypothetical protein
MDQNETEFFTIVDGHSRHRYQCFLAEMFLDRPKEQYVLCFRPAGAKIDDPNRYACRYIRVDVAEVSRIGSGHKLTTGFTARLHWELASLA